MNTMPAAAISPPPEPVRVISDTRSDITYAVKFPGSEWIKLIGFGIVQLVSIIVVVVQMRADIKVNSVAIQSEIAQRQSADAIHDAAMVRMSDNLARLGEKLSELNGYVRHGAPEP